MFCMGFFCPICYAKQEDKQTKLSENLFKKRTRVRCDANIAGVFLRTIVALKNYTEMVLKNHVR